MPRRYRLGGGGVMVDGVMYARSLLPEALPEFDVISIEWRQARVARGPSLGRRIGGCVRPKPRSRRAPSSDYRAFSLFELHKLRWLFLLIRQAPEPSS